MLKSIYLENFKAFGKRTKIDLAPITLIYGQNSAGKSSILHSLNLLKQTYESRDNNAVLLPRTEKWLVDFGSFQELLFDHDLNKHLSIRLDLDQKKNINFPFPKDMKKYINPIGLELTFQRISLDDDIELKEIKILLDDSNETLFVFKPKISDANTLKKIHPMFNLIFREKRLKSENIKIAECSSATINPEIWEKAYETINKRKDRILKSMERKLNLLLQRKEKFKNRKSSTFNDNKENEVELIKESISFYQKDFTLNEFIERREKLLIGSNIILDKFLPNWWDIKEELKEDEYLSGIRLFDNIYFSHYVLSYFSRTFSNFLESIFPMGPFRRAPQRWYIYTGTEPTDVGYNGDLLPDLLYKNKNLVSQVNNWLKKLDIDYELNIEYLGRKTKDLFEVKLKDCRRINEVFVGLTDVGFGISQILPLIVQSLSKKGQLITIEQPEVHIHPKLQADLGELLAHAIKDPLNKQFIIETHSEHLVLRIQKLIRNGKLKPEDVSVLFVSRGIEGSEITKLRLNEKGRFIDAWPGGFFPERRIELRG